MLRLFRHIPAPLLIILAAGLLFVPFLGAARLFDWDEINFAECAREMLVTGDYLRVTIDYSPFWEKPPLFIWAQAAAMHIFGVSEFAARLPNAIIGMITLPLLYWWGSRLRSQRFGLLWAGAYCGSFLPHFYFRSAIIDPLFNLLIFAGIMTLAAGDEARPVRRSALAGAFIGLAMLTKGPVALLVAGLTWAIIIGIKFLRRTAGEISIFRQNIPLLGIFLLCAVIGASLWFGVDILRNGTWFVTEFIRYQIRLLTTGDAGHSGPFYYHALVLLFGCFPASVLMLPALFSSKGEARFRAYRLWNIVLFLVVLVLFSVVKTKIVHYSSLCYFPLTFLAAGWADDVIGGVVQWKRRHTSTLAVFVVLWAMALAAVPLIGLNKEALLPLIHDSFARANLSAPVAWTGWETGVGILYLVMAASGVILLAKKRAAAGFAALFSATAVAVWLFLPVIAPKIEGYTQSAPTQFYESLQGQECYIKPVGFKSYAHLFYSRKPQHLSAAALGIAPDDFEHWLFEGAIDKPAYFVCKQQNADICRRQKNLRQIDEKAGFMFFERLPTIGK